jgi:ABC-type branched-subunit amino acid transport system substrate-binding protein
VALTIASCRTGRARTQLPPPQYLGDFRGAPTAVDPAFAEPWEALQSAVAADPGSVATVEAADRLLAAGPPFELRLWGVHAKANATYLAGDDDGAVRMVDQVLAAAARESAPDAISALNLLLCRALVRSGDPARGLVVLDSPALEREGVVTADEALALRAIGLDRAGRPEALVAFVKWRAAITVDDAAGAFALRRAKALGSAMGSRATAKAAEGEGGATAACLRGLSGAAIGELDPPWLAQCQAAPPKIGILLPRTGPMAVLADTHLAAATAALEVIGSRPGSRDVVWQDAGADASSAADGAAALVAAGVNVIVGPVGPAAVRAAKARVGGSARIVVPGEPVGDVTGAAPTLERRVAALVGVAVDRGATEVIVLAPESSYGKRAQAAAAAALADAKRPKPRAVSYPAESTSFAPVTDPFVKSLGPRTAVVIADHVARTELIVRQLTRDGKGPASKGGPLVLATAEGIADAPTATGQDVLAELIVAPTAATTPRAEPFARAFTAAEGTAPPDQALLVHQALLLAFDGAPPDPMPVVLARVLGGRLVVEADP